MNKKELRKIFLQKRKDLSKQQFDRYNLHLEKTFFAQVDIKKYSIIHIYLPILKFKEPDTLLLIKRFKKEFPHATILIPFTDQEKNQLRNCIITDETILKDNKWSIPEPENPTFTNEEPDLVILPLLAFDKRGYRVGYGKGFYDRYLSKLKKKPLKVGLSFFEPIEIIEDIDQYDIPMDKCIVNDQIFNF